MKLILFKMKFIHDLKKESDMNWKEVASKINIDFPYWTGIDKLPMKEGTIINYGKIWARLTTESQKLITKACNGSNLQSGYITITILPTKLLNLKERGTLQEQIIQKILNQPTKPTSLLIEKWIDECNFCFF